MSPGQLGSSAPPSSARCSPARRTWWRWSSRAATSRTFRASTSSVIEVDVRDGDALIKACDGARFIFHLAAMYRFWAPQPKDFYDVNVGGVLNIVEAARQGGCERIVYTSTVGVLGLDGAARGEAADETCYADVAHLFGLYKRTKYVAEHEVLRAAAQGAPVSLVLPTFPIGPGDVRPTPTGKLVLDFLNGKIPAFVDTTLNVVHVDDLATGHLLALERGAIGRSYIVGGENMGMGPFLAGLAAVTGLPAPRLQVPRALALGVGALSQLVEGRILKREPFAALEAARMSTTNMMFTDARARQELGYSLATRLRSDGRRGTLVCRTRLREPEAAPPDAPRLQQLGDSRPGFASSSRREPSSGSSSLERPAPRVNGRGSASSYYVVGGSPRNHRRSRCSRAGSATWTGRCPESCAWGVGWSPPRCSSDWSPCSVVRPRVTRWSPSIRRGPSPTAASPAHTLPPVPPRPHFSSSTSPFRPCPRYGRSSRAAFPLSSGLVTPCRFPRSTQWELAARTGTRRCIAGRSAARALSPTLNVGYASWVVLLAGFVGLLRAAGRGRTRWEAFGALLLAVVPIVWMPLLFEYHPQDLVALGLGLGGTACVLRGQWLWAGLLVGLAITSQQFGLLVLVPLVIVAPGRNRWRLLVASAVAIALVSVPFLLATSGRAIHAVLTGTGDSETHGGTVLWNLLSHPNPFGGTQTAPLVFISRVGPIVVSRGPRLVGCSTPRPTRPRTDSTACH